MLVFGYLAIESLSLTHCNHCYSPDATQFLFTAMILRGKSREEWGNFTSPQALFSSFKTGQPPALAAHCDFTPQAIPDIVEALIDADIGKQLKTNNKRVVGISLWRPLTTIRRDPFTFMDGNSLDPATECEVVPRLTPDGMPYENRAVKFTTNTQNHKWYWLSTQQPTEMTLVKLADSNPPPGTVECSPHCSFALPDSAEHQDPRESVEIRCVVVF